MRRPLAYVLAWSLATVVAVTGSWVGLQPLLAATSPELPTRLSAAQLRDAAPLTPSTEPSSPSPSPSESPSPSPSPSPTESPEPPPPQPQLPATSEWKEIRDGVYERTFIVRGGEVVFRASRREVDVVEHTGNPGYEVSVNRWSRSSVIFSFESVEQTSRIWVMWRGSPYAEVTETV